MFCDIENMSKQHTGGANTHMKIYIYIYIIYMSELLPLWSKCCLEKRRGLLPYSVRQQVLLHCKKKTESALVRAIAYFYFHHSDPRLRPGTVAVAVAVIVEEAALALGFLARSGVENWGRTSLLLDAAGHECRGTIVGCQNAKTCVFQVAHFWKVGQSYQAPPNHKHIST